MPDERKLDLRKPSRAESGRRLFQEGCVRLPDHEPGMLSVRGQPALSPSYVKKQLPDLMEAEKAGTLWTPLYPPSSGQAQGFRCNYASEIEKKLYTADLIRCGRVTRTERGMRSHLWRVHRVKQQREFYAMSKEEWDKG